MAGRSFRELLAQIESFLANGASADLALVQQALNSGKPDFVNLLRYKARRREGAGLRAGPLLAGGDAAGQNCHQGAVWPGPCYSNVCAAPGGLWPPLRSHLYPP